MGRVQSLYIFPTVLWGCVSLLSLSGLLFLIWSLRGRRIGDEPHCARCGYILPQAASGRCPECGSPFSPDNTKRGTRQRLWIRAGIGALLIILAVLMVYGPIAGFVRRHNWYQYKPSAWVLSDVDSSLYIGSGNMLRYRAVHELIWRDREGRLDDSTRKKFIEKSLQESATITGRSNFLDFLAKSLVLGRLDDQQQQRFMDLATRMTMKSTSVIGEGDEIAYAVSYQRLPSVEEGFLSSLARLGECRIDGKVIAPSEEAQGDEGNKRVFLPGGAIGKHTNEQDMTCTVSYAPRGEASREIATLRKTLRNTYHVVPRGEAPAVRLFDGAELTAKVERTVEPKEITTYWFYLEAKPREPVLFARVRIDLERIPCDMAFEVLLTIDGEQKAIGSIWAAKGDYTIKYTQARVERRLPEKVGVILRPSASLARRIPGAQEIYGKELTFSGVPVKQDWTAAPQPSMQEMPDADHPIVLEPLWGEGAKVALGWKAIRTNTGFEIWRSMKVDFSDSKKVGETGPGETTFVDTVPDPIQQHYYRVYFRQPEGTTQPAATNEVR